MSHHSNYDQKLRRQACIACVVGFLWLIMIGVITTHALYRYNQVTDAKRLVDQAVATIEKQYPEARQTLVTEIESSAPEYAETMSQAALDSAPDFRQQLEKFIARQIDRGAGQLFQLSSDEFEQYLSENRDFYGQYLAQLDQAPEAVTDTAEAMDEQVEQLVGIDLRKQLDSLLTTHQQINQRLARLEGNAGLTPVELIERRILRILRALEQQYL